MMKKSPLFIFLLIICYGNSNAQVKSETPGSEPIKPEAVSGPGLALNEIFFEPYLPGVRPEFIRFSANLNGILFSWNDSSYSETGTYLVDLNGSNLTKAPEDIIEDFQLSPDLSEVAYAADNSLILTDNEFSVKRVLIEAMSEISDISWSPEGSLIAYSVDNDIWIAAADSMYVKQVTRHKDIEPAFEIEHWAGSDAILMRSSDYTDTDTLYFPDYTGKYVTPDPEQRGIPETTFAVADLHTGRIDTLVQDVNRSMTDVSDSGRYIAIDYADAALKNREIRVYDMKDGELNIVFSDSTSGWLHDTLIEFNPSEDILMFKSERDNWNHIYTVHADGSGLKQQTSGKFEVSWAAWLDSSTIVYASSEEDPGERHIYILDIRDGGRQKLTEEPAFRYRFQLSPDSRFVLYAKTRFNQPYDFYHLQVDQAEEKRVTETVPDQFYDIPWQQEDYIRFTGRDGTTEISMSVLYPPGFDNRISYPVVVFYHGAGSLQNVYRGWSENYFREYMFNQFLNQHDYIVVEVDFRHSTGYGRKFREDVTNRMGKYETNDTIDGLNWLQENVGGLDMERVGSYGGSYGGFLALYSASVEPEYFHAAAALRAVTDWRNYYRSNPWYTLPRLGTPEKHPEHYDRSSPVTYASEMQHPVLLLHGLQDENVGFQDAAHYIDALIGSGHEEFKMMMYPSEGHSFDSPESWYDEYRRIFEFFEEEVKNRNP